MGVLANAENPVLAHLYLNYLLDNDVAEKNFSWVGYLPAITKLDADYVIAAGYVPEHLRNCVPTNEEIAKALVPQAARRRGRRASTRPRGPSSPPAADRVTAAVATRRARAAHAASGHAFAAARRRLADRVLRRVGLRGDGGRLRRRRPVPEDTHSRVEPAAVGLHHDGQRARRGVRRLPRQRVRAHVRRSSASPCWAASSSATRSRTTWPARPAVTRACCSRRWCCRSGSAT